MRIAIRVLLFAARILIFAIRALMGSAHDCLELLAPTLVHLLSAARR